MTLQYSIEDFKSRLAGGGVRATMFQVEMVFPTDIVPDPSQATQDGVFLIKAASIPKSEIKAITVPFRGRELKVSGDRTFEDWSVRVTNDVTFGLRKAFEEWSEKIQNHNYALGANTLEDYFSTAIVRQLDRDGQQLRSYQFQCIWPKSVGSVELSFNSNDEVEEYEVIFAVQYWSAAENGNPTVSPVPVASTSNLDAITT